MSQNEETVRRIFDSYAEGDFLPGAEALDPHAMFIVSDSFPESGAFVGPKGASEFMATFLKQWDQLRIEAEEYRTVGDTVIVWALVHGTGRSSGVAGDLRYFQLFTFRGPKIVRIECFLEEADALEAVGLSSF